MPHTPPKKQPKPKRKVGPISGALWHWTAPYPLIEPPKSKES